MLAVCFYTSNCSPLLKPFGQRVLLSSRTVRRFRTHNTLPADCYRSFLPSDFPRMWRSRTKLEDSKFEAERRLKYRGAARIALDAVHLTEEPDVRQVEHLKKIFRKEGCRPEHIVNHVLLLIDQPCLDAALRTSGLSSTALLQNAHDEYPELRISSGRQLACIHGKHRIQAGREFLSIREKWWVADLYLAGKFLHISSRVSFIQCIFRHQPPGPAIPDRGIFERGTPNGRRDLS